MNDFVAGPLFTPSPGVSYGPGPMNNTGRWTPNGMPGSSWDNPFGDGFQMPNMGGLMQQQPMHPMGQEFEPGYGGGGEGGMPLERKRINGKATLSPRGMRPSSGLPSMAPPTPQPPKAPGKLVYGRGGSMMWQRDEIGGTPSTSGGFGGAFANGGIAPAGKVSIVGERGPELIMPTGPTKVVPMPSMRLIEAQKQNAIAGQNQRDLDAKFGAQPQAMRSIDAAFTDDSLSGRASARDGAVRTGSLSVRGATPVGSGRMTPERRMQMLSRRAWTRGDDSAVANLTQAAFGMEQRSIDRAFQAGQQGAQQDFMRERDATNHAQGMEMMGIDRAFRSGDQAQQRQDALDAEQRRNQRGDEEWNRGRNAELEDRKNSAIDAPFTMTDPSGKFVIPGVKTRGGEFKPMGGAYPVKKPETAPTAGQIGAMRDDAEKRGYDLVQLPSGEWKLERKNQTKDQGSETTVYDESGKATQRTVRKPKGGSAGKGTGYW